MTDLFQETLTPLLRLKPFFLLRDGIFSPWERGRRQNQAPVPVTTRRQQAEVATLTALHHVSGEISWSNAESENPVIHPAALLANMGNQISADLAFLGNGFEAGPAALVEGDAANCRVHSSARISRFAGFNTEAGPIVIDAGAVVGAFSFVRGPAYIGQKTQLDACRFSNAIAGENCRLGGEIADSIIGDFSNKHHEGFLGHSLVGDWVNLGALTTTSDLKNNYGEVRLTFRDNKYPAGTIKFGSIIGDYAKTAIGTMLGTGSIIDVGANLFGLSHRSGYFRPFLWGETKIYDRSKFIEDAARMMQRRSQTVTAELEKLLRAI